MAIYATFARPDVLPGFLAHSVRRASLLWPYMQPLHAPMYCQDSLPTQCVVRRYYGHICNLCTPRCTARIPCPQSDTTMCGFRRRHRRRCRRCHRIYPDHHPAALGQPVSLQLPPMFWYFAVVAPSSSVMSPPIVDAVATAAFRITAVPPISESVEMLFALKFTSPPFTSTLSTAVSLPMSSISSPPFTAMLLTPSAAPFNSPPFTEITEMHEPSFAVTSPPLRFRVPMVAPDLTTTDAPLFATEVGDAPSEITAVALEASSVPHLVATI